MSVAKSVSTYGEAEIQELLRLRATRLRSKPSSAQEEMPFWVAEFPVGDEQYAIPLSALRACVPLKMVTPVPLSPPHVIGVLRFQGEILTAFSLSALLEGRGWHADPSVLLVVDQGWGELLALDCESIPRQAGLPVQAVERAQASQSGAISDVPSPGKKVIHLIDLPRLLEKVGEVRRGG